MVSYKIGVCKVSPKGKDCTTTFEKLGYNGKTSVVLCKPLTGRMHQIRVHLQYLGELSFLFELCRQRVNSCLPFEKTFLRVAKLKKKPPFVSNVFW